VSFLQKEKEEAESQGTSHYIIIIPPIEESYSHEEVETFFTGSS